MSDTAGQKFVEIFDPTGVEICSRFSVRQYEDIVDQTAEQQAAIEALVEEVDRLARDTDTAV